ncbi:acetolactate decarboxylase [Marivirga arenosa]|uniref:Acetolactate decarboxylase n=1 Tax=Marivirga arenosa TaxID=3059076 RepID=A0AA51X516_9BACT|nr:acetolactate decarboxylase [Marivirga sp. BKB1-2]WNB16789.1 acetolactate decarboxylase [Marivirga sp. BKB1-2]
MSDFYFNKLMNLNILTIGLGLIILSMTACNTSHNQESGKHSDIRPEIEVVGAMKNVMWKGELDGNIYLDTIANKTGLYGLGPLSELKGELLINNGISYASKVLSDSSMTVEKNYDVSAPFFVYGNVTEWQAFDLPDEVKSISDIERFIIQHIDDYDKPFIFKLIGKVKSAKIHIQNLPEGSKVSSPKEAHVGQVNYTIEEVDAEIIGFFSKHHKGIFTHHDSFLHMHLITKDESKMGHLDAIEIVKMKLYLAKN